MRHHRLDLNLLVALDALLEEASVSRAAERVFLSQPAMSHALGRLREHFDDELLVLVGRGMVLTEKAESLKGEVRGILLRIQAVTRPTDRFEPATVKRHFRIAASDYFGSVAMPRLVADLAREAPSVTLELLPFSPRVSEEVERGEVDFLIAPSLYVAQGHPSRVLFQDEWVCIAWTENTRLNKRLSREQFRALEHVVKRENHPAFPPLDKLALDRAGLARKVGVSLPQYVSLPLAVVGTDRIATIQGRLAQQAARSLPLRIFKCPVAIPALHESMQWHTMRETDRGHEWMRHRVAAICGESGASGGP